MSKPNIIYLEGRPSAHIIHRRLAQSLGCTIDFIDPKVRWQGMGYGFAHNLLAWISNAKFLASKYHESDVFLIDNLHFTPVLMNYFFRKKKKLVVHLGSHTLYFMYANKFNPINNFLHKYILSKYDVLIFEGEMAKFFAERILKRKMLSFVTFLGVPSERASLLNSIVPDLNSFNIVVIANGPTDFRLFYKGLDLMIKAFEIACNTIDQLQLNVLGNWPEEIVDRLLGSVNADIEKKITFRGPVSELKEYLQSASLCIHCSRGDAFPTSTLEAMMAGVPTLISELTGTREVVSQVDRSLIVPLDERHIAASIVNYFNRPESEKREISMKCKMVTKKYTEENAIKYYQKTFEKIYPLQ